MIRCLFAALAVLLLGCGPARAEPPMWVVEDADSTLLIFGSFHLLPRGVAWRPKALDRALQEADDLWLEVAMDQPVNGAAQSQVAARGALPPGRTLSSMLSKDGARRLALIAGQAGMPVDRLDRLQPWLAETLLGVAVYRQQGALAEEGVEQQIAKTAPAGVRQVALESAGEQLAMLASGSEAVQLASLEHSLRLFEEDPGYYRRLMELWLKGDAAGMEREVIDELRRTAPEQYRTLIVERNHAWAPKIVQRMAGSGQTVLVVGVGHLLGPDGLPTMLRARGLRVRGPR
jgi:uncharacterized protein